MYVHEQDRADLISWRCILHMHRTYGVQAGFCAKNEEDFAAFVEAADNNPANKIIIRLTMDDPGTQAKKLEQVSDYLSPAALLVLVSDRDVTVTRRRRKMKACNSTTAPKTSELHWKGLRRV